MKEVIISIESGFLPQYDALPKDIKKKFEKQIAFLKTNPMHNSLQIHQIESTDFWEFYVDRGYRCIFKREGNVDRLYYVGTHKLIDRM
jgi:mRNA-degrading endonuclease RelE of RelBE toxin-antitoxin system